MKWKHPHISKIYEALGAIADDRVEVTGDTGKAYSSSRNKFYDISYDPISESIMSNDNSSFWKGELGYPSIAFLMKIGVLSYDIKMAELLKNIAWKDINQKYKNNFDKSLESILSEKTEKEREVLGEFVNKVDEEIKLLKLSLLGKKKEPPEGY